MSAMSANKSVIDKIEIADHIDENSEKKAVVKNKEKLKHIGEIPRRTRNTRSTSSSELKPDSISKKFNHAVNDSSTESDPTNIEDAVR